MGKMGFKHTTETIAKLRLLSSGKHPSIETRHAMSVAQTGRKHSDETKAKMRAARLGKHCTELTKEKLRIANLGKKLTGEHKVKFSKASLGKKFTEEHKDKLRYKRSPETRARMSLAQKGNTKCRGVKHTSETKLRMSLAKKQQWQQLGYKEKTMRASMLGRFIHPNKPERAIQLLLGELFPLEWKFVGDGSFIIDCKNPDFINVNGQKKIVELFGDYWHKGENPQDRIDSFAKYGFSTLVIWERELKDMSKLTERLKSFCVAQ
jgi:hypothetical protein